jgi:hypothetical protein
MIEVLVGGVVFDTATDELTAGAMKAALEGVGWKNVTTRGGSMKKTYISVHVHDDGDNELTKLQLDSSQISTKFYNGDLIYDVDHDVKQLTNELLEYGNDPQEVQDAVTHMLASPVNTSCIIGKI